MNDMLIFIIFFWIVPGLLAYGIALNALRYGAFNIWPLVKSPFYLDALFAGLFGLFSFLGLIVSIWACFLAGVWGFQFTPYGDKKHKF